MARALGNTSKPSLIHHIRPVRHLCNVFSVVQFHLCPLHHRSGAHFRLGQCLPSERTSPPGVMQRATWTSILEMCTTFVASTLYFVISSQQMNLAHCSSQHIRFCGFGSNCNGVRFCNVHFEIWFLDLCGYCFAQVSSRHLWPAGLCMDGCQGGGGRFTRAP